MATALTTKDATVVAEAEKAAGDAGHDEDVHLTDEERDDDEEDDHDHEEDNEEIKRWDEGGKSDCGYRDSFHETLMSIGASIHKVVGDPSEKVKGMMKGVGNWFQEASYAARDWKRGEMNIAEEMKARDEEDEEDEEDEDKLETVAEESSKVGE